MAIEIEDDDGDTIEARPSLVEGHILICVRDSRKDIGASVILDLDQAYAIRDALTEMIGDAQ